MEMLLDRYSFRDVSILVILSFTTKFNRKLLEKIFSTGRPSQARMHPNRCDSNRKSKIFKDFASRRNKKFMLSKIKEIGRI